MAVYRRNAIVIHRKQVFLSGLMPILESFAAIQLQDAQIKEDITQLYAPIADKDEEELEKIIIEVHRAMNIVKSRDVTIVMGDFNGKIGKGKRRLYRRIRSWNKK
ncbi:hypothetical protein J437_LFUL012040 [Ladona fulva]|uniref:Craniofacial development protein 2-like n=1 Tax=Ladona fulva TaxID=123851 RepID=A0A8K0KG69_LADFU|nr:hypothetical protein J437_LFUL012040 [Ladona fulva]